MSQAKKWPVFPPHHRLLLPPPPPPPSAAAAVGIPGRACARIFILRELRRLYNLPVVRRYEVAYARIAITTRLALGHRLGDCLAGLALGRRGGGRRIKKKEGTRRQVRNTAEQLRHGNRCPAATAAAAAVAASQRHCFRPPAKRNWAKRPYDDGRNIDDDDDYGACNLFNVANTDSTLIIVIST